VASPILEVSEEFVSDSLKNGYVNRGRYYTSAMVGWFLLIAVDLIVTIGGFGLLYRIIRGVPTRHWLLFYVLPPSEVLVALRLAHAFVPRHLHCLRYCAAGACLLRFHGYSASLVIGIINRPFLSHAWIENGDKTYGMSAPFRECVPLLRV